MKFEKFFVRVIKTKYIIMTEEMFFIFFYFGKSFTKRVQITFLLYDSSLYLFHTIVFNFFKTLFIPSTHVYWNRTLTVLSGYLFWVACTEKTHRGKLNRLCRKYWQEKDPWNAHYTSNVEKNLNILDIQN